MLCPYDYLYLTKLQSAVTCWVRCLRRAVTLLRRSKRSYAVGVRAACRRQASRSRSVSPWEKRRLYATLSVTQIHRQTPNIDDIYPPLTFSCDNSQGGRAPHWLVKGG